MTAREERMIAFIDGELEGEDLRAFEEEMAADPSLADEVARLMSNDALLRDAFDAPMHEDVDDALLARMGMGISDEDTGNVRDIEVVDLDRHRRESGAANDNRPFLQRWAVPIGGALAATFAAVAFFGTGGGTGGNSFDRALGDTPSLQVARLDNGSELTPLLTFEAADGSYCREFSIARGDDAGGSGIACNRGGAWEVEAMEKGAVELADPGEIALASGEDGAGLDAAYARLGAGDPLDATGESALIASGWKER